MVELNAKQLEQLHRALMEAFPNFKELEQLVDYKLDFQLTAIVSANDPQETVVHELIKAVRAKGKVKDLVECAYEESPNSPTLKTFYNDIWHPLISLPRIVHSPPGIPHQTISQVIDLEARRSSTETSEIRVISQLPNTNEQSIFQRRAALNPPLSSGQRSTQENMLAPMQEYTKNAYNTINTIISILQPEKNIYRDQCYFAILKVNDTRTAIQQIPVSLVQLTDRQISVCYLLDSEQAYFDDEAKKAIVSLRQLSEQTSSLLFRKEVWDHMHRLMKSLQAIGRLLEDSTKSEKK